MQSPTLNSEMSTGDIISATDSTLVLSSLSSSHSQPVLIDSASSCVHYDLAGLMVTVFLHCDPVPLPWDSCDWSSHTPAGESELRRTDIGLSVEGSEGDIC